MKILNREQKTTHEEQRNLWIIQTKINFNYSSIKFLEVLKHLVNNYSHWNKGKNNYWILAKNDGKQCETTHFDANYNSTQFIFQRHVGYHFVTRHYSNL